MNISDSLLENWKKISEDPVCFGVHDDSFGGFSIRESGLIYTFKLVHRNGSVTCNPRYKLNNWGCTHPLFGENQLLTVITYPNRSALLIANYLRGKAGCDYKYTRISWRGPMLTLQSWFSIAFYIHCPFQSAKSFKFGTGKI